MLYLSNLLIVFLSTHSQLWHRLATCQRALRKFEDAIASLQQCLRLEPDNSRVMQDIAEITEQMEGKQGTVEQNFSASYLFALDASMQ